MGRQYFTVLITSTSPFRRYGVRSTYYHHIWVSTTVVAVLPMHLQKVSRYRLTLAHQRLPSKDPMPVIVIARVSAAAVGPPATSAGGTETCEYGVELAKIANGSSPGSSDTTPC